MKRIRKNLSGLLTVGLLGVGLLSACGTPPRVPDDSFYRLSPHAAKAGALALKGSVEVNRFVASGSLGNRPLLFSEPGSNAVNAYHYHFWIEAPPILLQSALVSYLRSSGVAAQVVTPNMRVAADYTVSGRVLRLETVRGDRPTATVAFELTLRRERDGKLLVLNEYRVEVPADKKGIEADVAAIERAVDTVFARFVADIAQSKP